VKVFVNAVSIKEGGSLVVLCRLLEELQRLRDDIDWHVAVCSQPSVLRALESNRVKLLIYPWVNRSPLHLKFWYEWELRRRVRKLGADVLFSLTNYLPHISVAVPGLLLVQHAGHFCPLFKALTEEFYPGFLARLAWALKSRWVRDSIKRATVVTVQTHALARAIIRDNCASDTSQNLAYKKISMFYFRQSGNLFRVGTKSGLF